MCSNTRGAHMEKKIMDAVEKKMCEMMEMFSKSQAEMTQAIAAISLQNNKMKSLEEESSGTKKMEEEEEEGEWGRATRYEFPKFDGDGFEGWMMRAEYFFEVKVAAIHLERKKLQWHRGFSSLSREEFGVSWKEYIAALAARFGKHAYEDPLADLRNLWQKGSLQSYMDEFDELYPRASIRADQALSLFLSGLVDELQMPVRMFNPKSLAEAYSLAKLQELTVKAMGIKARGNVQGNTVLALPYYSNTKSLAVTATNYKQYGVESSSGNRENNRGWGVRPSARLTGKEMDEKRAKGLCFTCDEKYVPGHQCANRKAYTIYMVEEPTSDGEEGEAEIVIRKEGSAEDLQLSLHAVWGKKWTSSHED